MSASLVGSEMCIRDRAPSTFLRKAASEQATSARAGARPARRTRPRDSVSYTHLTLPTICSV
eukprot:2145953-Alexandrium_andersonii.AAC.1